MSREQDEEDRRRVGLTGLRSWSFGIVVLVLVVAGLYSWLTGVDVDLDVSRLLTIAFIVGAIIGLIAIINAFSKFFGSDSVDETPPALQGNTGCAVIILVVLGLVGLMVLIPRMRDDVEPKPRAPAADPRNQPVERPDTESAPREE